MKLFRLHTLNLCPYTTLHTSTSLVRSPVLSTLITPLAFTRTIGEIFALSSPFSLSLKGLPCTLSQSLSLLRLKRPEISLALFHTRCNHLACCKVACSEISHNALYTLVWHRSRIPSRLLPSFRIRRLAHHSRRTCMRSMVLLHFRVPASQAWKLFLFDTALPPRA
jgi:hypothetical protein